MVTTTQSVGDYPTADTVRDEMLALIFAHLIRNGVPAASARAATQKGGDRWMVASGVAQVAARVLANNRVAEDATMPDTATGDNLTRLAAVFGVQRSAGAGATGDVVAGCSGTVTYAEGQECVGRSNKKRYRVITTTVATNGDPIPVQGIDTGTATNLAAGEILDWVSPPAGSLGTTVVDAGGLVDGADADNDGRLRKRLLKRLQEPQNGGSWSHVRQWLEDASAAVEDAYVYPAAQGPGTVHWAYTVEGTRDNDYARSGSAALTLKLANYLVTQAPEFAEAIGTTVAHEDLSAVFKATLPDPVSEGGVGGGWVNESAARWPPANASAGVTVATITAPNKFTTSVTTTPTAGTTRIQIFQSATREVVDARVVAYSGSVPNLTITLDKPLPDLSVGDHLFPAIERGSDICDAFQEQIALLDPGEKTSNADVLPRAYRHPREADGFPSTVTTKQLSKLQTDFSEFTNLTYFALNGSTSYTLPLAPSLPAAVTDPPNVWRVKHLGIYES